MKNNRIALLSSMAVLVLLALSVQVQAAVTVEVRYLNPRMQVFIVGDILKGDAIEGGGSVGLEDFNEFFWMKISATAPHLDVPVYIHFYEDLEKGGSSDRLIDYYSSSNVSEAFTLAKFIQESNDGAGTYANTDIANVEATDWFARDYTKTEMADVSTVLENLENGLFPTSTFKLGVEVYDLSGNKLAEKVQILKVYNPAKPVVSLPTNESTPSNLNSIQFSWTWPSGGLTLASDWNLVIVDAGTDKPADPESVISDKTPANTRFDGNPSTTTGHNYTGTGAGEAELQRDRWYCWQVSVEAPATLANSTKAYESEVRTFSTIVDPSTIAGYSSILYNALMVEGGDLIWVMEDVKAQFQGFVPIQIKADKDGADIADQTAVDEIKAKKDQTKTVEVE